MTKRKRPILIKSQLTKQLAEKPVVCDVTPPRELHSSTSQEAGFCRAGSKFTRALTKLPRQALPFFKHVCFGLGEDETT